MSTLHPLLAAITSEDSAVRDQSLGQLIAGWSTAQVLSACETLEEFRKRSDNLYERARATMFLHALYRFRIQEAPDVPTTGLIPFDGFEDLLGRRLEQAVASFRGAAARDGHNSALASALAQAYEQITFQTLADQVRRSVQGCAGNRWMFRVGHPDEHSLRLHSALLDRDAATGLYPILVERTPVRLDLSHSGWSDIFFLGMDYPEGARVLNISVDLGVYGRDTQPLPPIETYVRVIDEPLLRLTSVDLAACKDVTTLNELFNFGNDYLGLVKAGVIASGLIPPSFEGTGVPLRELLEGLVRPGCGLEVVSKVNDIPKGSRLAVSTNLLASLISLLMRATGQAQNLTGQLNRDELRLVVGRAILGEWMGGSGGGWQDSGGIFPGVKLIQGRGAAPGDPEWGISRGRLLPVHELLGATRQDMPQAGERRQGDPQATSPTRSADDSHALDRALAGSLVLVHGGMAQNVGPILNMVTAKYLLRSEDEWQHRQEALRVFEQIVQAVQQANVAEVGRLTMANWEGPLKGIIPWVSNQFTESIINEARRRLGADFWGFLMLGGMSGGGMGFFVAPERRAAFRDELLEVMQRCKFELQEALPFVMDPVVYDFQINPQGTVAALHVGSAALMPPRYYPLQAAQMSAAGIDKVAPQRILDLNRFADQAAQPEGVAAIFRTMVATLFPVSRGTDASVGDADAAAEQLRLENGFDLVQHAQLRDDLQHGRIGLARNRLPIDTDIRDVADSDVIAVDRCDAQTVCVGEQALRRGEVAVVSLAAGVGSRWTTGAGVVKALSPFVVIEGRHRNFLEIHLAKTRQSCRRFEQPVSHVVTTSYLTHAAVARFLERESGLWGDVSVMLSRGQSIGQRLIPMARDLAFLWEEIVHETLDENKQKVRDNARREILEWVRSRGEGTDYADNLATQRFNPPGHFYEVPNLLRNGVLLELLERQPQTRWLMVHNIDTLGADLDPAVVGAAIGASATLAFEVVPRRIDDRGGGLARVNDRVRLLEGLASPREEAEFRLRYYNTLTTWVNIDGFLRALHLTRDDLRGDPHKVTAAIRALAARVPTYVTIKDVKRRWGHGHEDVLPVAQFEKLWGDLTSLPELRCAYLAVPRRRGQQLKDPAQLDGWANDGSRQHVVGLCDFGPR
ncbi:MAG: UTP--glucose-1-phosphate uridylyltransferase [Planctomycetales bacterium]